MTAVEDLIALRVEVTSITADHCRAAFAWAERLNQARAYDGFYLAVAEELGAVLVTADSRLANGTQQLGISWVKWIGDAD